MEPGNLTMAAIEAVNRLGLNAQHWEWALKVCEKDANDLAYALTELEHHFREHGLSRGSLTVRTQETLVALDLGAYGAN